MSMINVTVGAGGHRCGAKIEDYPVQVVATRGGKPVKSFWADMVMVMSRTDLERLREPGGNCMVPITVEGEAGDWAIHDPVVYGENASPVGGLVVFVLRFDRAEVLKPGLNPSVN